MAKDKNTNNQLFVYGTLAPGRENQHVLSPLNGKWTPGFVRGNLQSHGWGATFAFPGIRLDPDGAEVPGFLFTSSALSSFWEKLDEFEGEGYRRTLTKATLADGSSVECFIYELRDEES